MRLTSLEIPDDPQQWAPWLEEAIAGSHLGELVDELVILLDVKTEGATLTEICGPQLPAVAERGLSALSSAQIRSLLRSPQRLLDLQEWLLVEGGDYWQRSFSAVELSTDSRAAWSRLKLQLEQHSQPPASPRASRRNWMVAVAALATALLISVGVWLQQPSTSEWGWNRPGVMTANVSGKEFREQLATAAEEWFQQPRDTPEQLERELVAFRRACDVLVAAPLTQLPEAEREPLRKRCRAWADKFDARLAELRGQQRPWQEIRTDADSTVRTLANAIRNPA